MSTIQADTLQTRLGAYTTSVANLPKLSGAVTTGNVPIFGSTTNTIVDGYAVIGTVTSSTVSLVKSSAIKTAIASVSYWTLAGSNIYRNSRVGIGNSNPQYNLDVYSNDESTTYAAYFYNASSSPGRPGIYIRTNSNTGQNIVLANAHATAEAEMILARFQRASTADYTFLACESNTGLDVEFTLKGDGNAYADVAWNGGGAGIGHMFENASEIKIPFGVTVVIEGSKCRPATTEDGTDIYGVVCHPSKPSFVCMPGWNKWEGKFKRHALGHYELDEKGERILSDKFDSKLEYIPRNKRPEEYSVVEYSGLIRILDGQPVNPRWKFQRDIEGGVKEYLI